MPIMIRDLSNMFQQMSGMPINSKGGKSMLKQAGIDTSSKQYQAVMKRMGASAGAGVAYTPAYYDKPLSVKIADYYSRSAQGGVGFAKCAGNYAASFFPTGEAQKDGYDQIIWTDSIEHKYIEEAGTMNVMVRIGDKLLTAPTSERILNGVTRDSLLTLAKDNGYDVEIRPVAVQEMYDAYQNGNLKEVFGCGTAVVVNAYNAVGFGEERATIDILPEEESYAVQLKKKLNEIQYGLVEDPYGWRVKVG